MCAKSILNLVLSSKLDFDTRQQKDVKKIDNKLNQYYIKHRIILEIDLKTIHEELAIVLALNIPSYSTVVTRAKHFLERIAIVYG